MDKKYSVFVSPTFIDLVERRYTPNELLYKKVQEKSAGNVQKYWTLTPYGNKLMMKLKAIKKNEK